MAQQKLTLEQRFAARSANILRWSPDINAAISELRREEHTGQEYAEDRNQAFELMDEIIAEGFYPAVVIRNPRDDAPMECTIQDPKSKRLFIGEGDTLALALCALYVQFREAFGKEGEGDCDERCANARGETCNCVCGGVNHGKNLKD